jgi:hypothetical protein
MIYFTYTGDYDGLGAQYQRIVSIISFAARLGVEYVHTKIKNIEHINDADYLEKIEDYFQISNNFKSVNDVIYDNELNIGTSIDGILIYEFISFIENERSTSRNIIVYIHSCYNVIDMIDIRDIPENEKFGLIVYDYGMPKLQQIKKNIPLPEYNKNQNVNIAIHIRRGDIEKTDQGRYISLDIYQKHINILSSQIPNANIFIFTQITPENKDEFDAFQIQNPTVKILADIDIITTLEYLIKADILVMGKSSLSYVAGLYNTNLVIYNSFGHMPIKRWYGLNQ